MFEENKDESRSLKRRGEASIIYVVTLVLLIVVGGVLVYDFWSLPFFGNPWYGGLSPESGSIGLLAYFLWLVLAIFFFAPYLTTKMIRRLYPTGAQPSVSFRARIRGFPSEVSEFIGDISHLFRRLFMIWYLAFLLPAGILVAIGFGSWFYLLPFLAANIIVVYKFNNARKVRGVEGYDDKHFANSKKSLDDYVDLIKKSKRWKERHETQP